MSVGLTHFEISCHLNSSVALEAKGLTLIQRISFPGGQLLNPFSKTSAIDPYVTGLVACMRAASGKVRAVDGINVATDLISDFSRAVQHI
jgi:hypothetical protein